jgi:hypothetical protein
VTQLHTQALGSLFVASYYSQVQRCPYTYESGSARLPRSPTRLCVGRHEPGSAESGLARQGLRWDSARYRLVRVWVVPSQARISTRTDESGSARVPMSQTRLCVGRHEPGSAESSLARQGFRRGSARRRLAIGSHLCGWSRARLAYLHGHTQIV